MICYTCCILVNSVFASDSSKEQRPNFVFILTDDQRYDYLGCTGNELIQTPEIDKLASEGILFTNAHITSAICTPSRISILLSQFERKHGVNFNSGTSVAEEAWQQSYPVVMRRNGYYTGYIGKNHSPVGEGGYSSGVMEESFDYWYAGHGHLSFLSKKKASRSLKVPIRIHKWKLWTRGYLIFSAMNKALKGQNGSWRIVLNRSTILLECVPQPSPWIQHQYYGATRLRFFHLSNLVSRSGDSLARELQETSCRR